MQACPLDRSPREEVKVGVAGFWGQAGSPSLKQLVVRCHIKDSARPLGKAPFHISRRVKHRNSPMGGGETGGAQTLPPGHSQAFWVPEGSPKQDVALGAPAGPPTMGQCPLGVCLPAQRRGLGPRESCGEGVGAEQAQAGVSMELAVTLGSPRAGRAGPAPDNSKTTLWAGRCSSLPQRLPETSLSPTPKVLPPEPEGPLPSREIIHALV